MAEKLRFVILLLSNGFKNKLHLLISKYKYRYTANHVSIMYNNYK